ncbi:Protein cortex [Gryllus bimaculatus]|nr:Protein cortex [Gryllus bimaculatus]
MSFSEVFRVEKDVFKFSLDGKYIAYAFQNNVYVRNVRSSKIVRTFPAVDIVQYIEWSPDSKFILCALYQSGIVQVLSLQFPKWKCKIKECDVGIKQATWSPDSRHILTVANFNVWVCIWSLSDLSVKYIYNLKSVINSVVEFSPDGKLLAAIEQHESSFCVATFSSTSWHLSKRYPCDKIEIIGGLSWAPDSNTICVWDRRVDICRVLIVSLLKNGVCIFERQSMGVKTVSWSPSGQFLALGCYDGKIRLLNHITWSQLNVFEHTARIDSSVCTVYKEILVPIKVVAVRPVSITPRAKCPKELTYHCGVWLNNFSTCGHFLVSSCETMPATLWIWNVQAGILHTFLSFDKPIVDVAWDPSSLRLAAVSASTNICLWTPASGASVVQTPESELWNIIVSGIKWHPWGHTLALNSKNIMTLLWFTGVTEFS